MIRVMFLLATAFSLSAATEVATVPDFYEVEGSGSDQALSWHSLDETAARAGGRLLLVGPGPHDPGPIAESGRNTWLILPAARIDGGPPAMTDGSALQANLGIGIAKFHNRPGNENTLFVSTRIAHADPASPSYQKNGLYVRLLQGDGSSYAPLDRNTGDRDINAHDGVGIESQAAIVNGNRAGRIWSYHGMSRVEPGADGRAVTAEFESLNFGSDEPASNVRNSKIGVHIVARGNANSTAAVYVTGAQGQRWNDAIVVNANGTASSAFAIRDPSQPGIVNLAVISVDGSARFASLKSDGLPVAVREFGATPERPRALGESDTGRFYFDTTLHKPIWWAGKTWVDATGNAV